MEKIIIICGPTGIGKTSFAISAAKQFDGEIIGADSMQIYKHMDIGTAKPAPEELKQARHHLVDFLDPKDDFDAGSYVKTADKAIEDIISRGKIPIIAGGTGLYIRALLNGLFRSESLCKKTMSQLEKELEEKGSLSLYQKLEHCDPAAAKNIHPNDSFRLIRALEVYQTTGKKISDQQRTHNFDDQRYSSIKIGLTMDREKLYDRINKRVDIMLDQGLLKEVTTLVEDGYSFDLKPMQSIGYKHMAMFIKNEIDWEEAVRLLKRDTRRYAKRQFTWFHKDKDIHWFFPSQDDLAQNLIKEFLT
ncbi:MAG: tRNA (adenosine(37)-N6)-dimethylallyltransferase MiaA [Proteobacteria bacterium]|nr:tRNA (adenosine(37)-N6)-dimethylallyltransferase MiaA [Pseudomonadota bacterium]MBU1584438.1 tRNA (adenosine(37)-N6)-dimethylallyltransferase MiaA [Pseudomonadota bacterium]MBU2454867.1 tRNA (adenosine(37)-N6)-dimethylallyltransferase MiaA [Pseudomonadota bacterium]MBU2629649.1 tRNA (adenosine(37)-N6)-dimethylallyltransferase MiaA [Pseudomonadota bacterium]